MAAIDAHVFVQLLVEKDAAQVKKAEAFLKKGRPLWISTVVLAEACRVLPLLHSWSKAQLLAALRGLLDSPDFSIQSADIVRLAVELYATAKADFPECLALELARAEGLLPMGTFNRDTGSLPGASTL